MNELNAIRFLRAAIHFEPATLDDGRPEPGWCCTEHAIVASLAFRLCDVDAFLCDGKMLIGGEKSRTVLDVIPHRFVVIGDPPQGVFDSSISYESIRGIPMRFAGYTDLAVGYMPRKPTKDDWIREFQEANKPVFALYSAKALKPPDKHVLAWVSTTPFGSWLTDRYGSQSGLWGKAAWFVAEHLSGRLTIADESLDKAAIWDSIASSADRDELILESLPEVDR